MIVWAAMMVEEVGNMIDVAAKDERAPAAFRSMT